MSAVLSATTALGTGASSGIGWETARLLAAQGATVIVHARTANEGEHALDHSSDIAQFLAPPSVADRLPTDGRGASRARACAHPAVRRG